MADKIRITVEITCDATLREEWVLDLTPEQFQEVQEETSTLLDLIERSHEVVVSQRDLGVEGETNREIVRYDVEPARFTPQDVTRLTELEVAFEHAGGRGVDVAEEIDALRRKRDGVFTAEEVVALLSDPDMVGESAYRAAYEAIADAVDSCEEGDDVLDMAIGQAENLVDHATATLVRLKAAR